MQRGLYIRPHYLLPELQRDYPQYWWNNRALGRILSGISAANGEDYLMGHESQARNRPIGKGRDAKGVYYCIDPKGGNEGILWLLRAREKTMKLALGVMEAEQRGTFDFSLGTEAQPSEQYVVWLGDSWTRTPTNYEAQCDMEPFLSAAPIERVKMQDDPYE
jgi:hypothetical protein